MEELEDYLEELENISEYDFDQNLEKQLEYQELKDDFWQEARTQLSNGEAVELMDYVEENQYSEAYKVLEQTDEL